MKQIEWENVMVDDSVYWVYENDKDENMEQNLGNNQDGGDEINLLAVDAEEDKVDLDKWMNSSIPAINVVEEFFGDLSDREFDKAFDLMILALRNSSEIRNHFTSYRMIPFLNWIEGWKLVPLNFEYVNSPTYWKDVYKFDLSYVMSSDQSKYDETWEATINTQWNEPMISSIRCVTNKCSYHPIFWPENFGLMK